MAPRRPPKAGVFALESGRLVQQVPEKPVEWSPEDGPATLVGNYDAANYEVGVKFQIEEGDVEDGAEAYAFAGVRVDGWNPNSKVGPSGLLLTVHPQKGEWHLSAGVRVLSRGKVELEDAYAEHEIRIRAQGDEIVGWLDGEEVVRIVWKDKTRGLYEHGLAVIGSGWHRAAFDDFYIVEV